MSASLSEKKKKKKNLNHQNQSGVGGGKKCRGIHQTNPWLAPDVIGDHVGVRNKSKKVFWEFGSNILQNASNIFLLFCTPTLPSNHVRADQEYQRRVL